MFIELKVFDVRSSNPNQLYFAENCSPSSRKRRSSSACSVESTKSITSSTVTSAATQSTLRTTDNNNTEAVQDKTDAKKSRSRRFKEDELAFLDAVYKTEPYPDPMITERLSIQLDVPEHRIKVNDSLDILLFLYKTSNVANIRVLLKINTTG